MRAPLVVPLVLAVLALVPLTHAAAGFVVATGTARHLYVTDGVCEDADASWVVEYATLVPRITAVSDTECVAGYFSQVTSCTGGPGADISCARDTALAHIRVTLRTTGHFNLSWVEPTFEEYVEGQLARTDV